MQQTYTIKTFAKALGLAESSVREMIRRGILVPRRHPPILGRKGKMYFLDEDVIAYHESTKPQRQPMRLKHIGR